MRYVKEALAVAAVLSVLMAIGCTSTEVQEKTPEYALDAKYLYDVKIKPPKAPTGMDAVKLKFLSQLGDHCRKLYDPGSLAKYVSDELKKAKLFTHVEPESGTSLALSRSTATAVATAAPGEIGPEAVAGDADLSLELNLSCPNLGAGVIVEGGEISGTPFGEGENATFSCVLSTVAWLFVGPGSWLVPDREFGNTESQPKIAPRLEIKAELDGAYYQDRPRIPITVSDYADSPVEIEKIDMRFVDRHNLRIAWLWNILLPPWTPPGLISPSYEELNESLAEEALKAYSENLIRKLREDFGKQLVDKSRAIMFVDTSAGGDGYLYLLLKGQGEFSSALVMLEGESPTGGSAILEEVRDAAGVQKRAEQVLAGGEQDMSAYERVYRVKIEDIEGFRSTGGRYVKLAVFGRDINDRIGTWTVTVKPN